MKERTMRFARLLAGSVLVLAGMLAPAAYAEAKLGTGIVYTYEHENYVQLMVARDTQNCQSGVTQTQNFSQLWPYSEGWKISSIQFSPGDPLNTRCNWIAVKGGPNNGGSNAWWSTCMNNRTGGIAHFGPGWNDNTVAASIGYYAGCPNWL